MAARPCRSRSTHRLDDFYRDLGESYRKATRAFADAGCRYLQLDEVNFAYLCDPKLRQVVADRGEDPQALPRIYANLINAAIADLPADMTVAMHLCRGNFRSTFVASGGYEPVAEILFNKINVDVYFMEYDSERAGSFEPLRFVPRGKTVVLGLVTSKSGNLESKDELKRRIEAATRFIAVDQLCLSPQCGFASTEEGNTLTEDEQWAKLARVVEGSRTRCGVAYRTHGRPGTHAWTQHPRKASVAIDELVKPAHLSVRRLILVEELELLAIRISRRNLPTLLVRILRRAARSPAQNPRLALRRAGALDSGGYAAAVLRPLPICCGRW